METRKLQKNINRIKEEQGSVTLFVVVSMMFFLLILVSLYLNTNNKIQAQESEIGKIQKEYNKGDMGEIYETLYLEYKNKQTPTVQVYAGDILKGEAKGDYKNVLKTIYTNSVETTLKFFGQEEYTYVYTTIEGGQIADIEGNTLKIKATTEGTTIYTYLKDKEGNINKYYTAVTIKLTKLEDKQIYVGEGKTVEIGNIQGENQGNISFDKIEDSSMIRLEEDKIKPQKIGTANISITESNGGMRVTYTIKIVKVTLSPNGGTYLMPTEGNATIKSNVKVENAEKIEIIWSNGTSKYTEIQNGETVSKTDCIEGTYYLEVRVDSEYNYKSKAFMVESNEKVENKITIKPNTKNWTNQDVTATITYGKGLTQNRKIGKGNTLQEASSTLTAITTDTTTVILNQNGYVYAEATDIAGNKVVVSMQISNIDKTLPTVGSVTGSTAIGNIGKITVNNITDTGGSGLKGIYISTSNTTPTATSVTWTANTASNYTKTVNGNGTYYIWVLDNAENVSKVKNCTVSGIVSKVKIESYDEQKIVRYNSEATTLKYSGIAKTKTFTSSDTSIATVNSSTGAVTGVKQGTATITVTLTNYDGTTVNKTCTITVYEPVAQITSTSRYYSSLLTAVNAVPATNVQTEIKMVNSTNATPVEIPNTKNIKLNLNNYRITNNSTTTTMIQNRGTLQIIGSGVINGATRVAITNHITGKLTITNGTITSSEQTTISNYGNFTFSNGTIQHTANTGGSVAFSNVGTANLNGGKITATNNWVIVNQSQEEQGVSTPPTIAINGAEIIGGNKGGINNKGKLTMDSGKIIVNGSNVSSVAIETFQDGWAFLRGGTINNTAKGTAVNNYGYTFIGNTTATDPINIIKITNNATDKQATVYNGESANGSAMYSGTYVRQLVFSSGTIENTSSTGYAVINKGKWSRGVNTKIIGNTQL